MKIFQEVYKAGKGWQTIKDAGLSSDQFELVLVFAANIYFEQDEIFSGIKAAYCNADILICSTAGEIIDSNVYDESISLTAIKFDSTKIKTATGKITNAGEGYHLGKQLSEGLDHDGLKAVMIILDGLLVDTNSLLEEVQKYLPADTIVTGGLAGDNKEFLATKVGLNQVPASGVVVALGFYGKNIKIGFGSIGGWDPFGTERIITKSAGNVLYELDGKPALDIYKRYLGEHASGLPASGLLFPLSIREDSIGEPLVRTLLSINEEEKSIRFAGNMPEGKLARLMKANFERLIDGASLAAQMSIETGVAQPELAILISCMGRKSLLLNRTDEEVEAIRDVFGLRTALTGFYSYGEIAPSQNGILCELHNETMTITTLTEI
jgi:hypothetical protein